MSAVSGWTDEDRARQVRATGDFLQKVAQHQIRRFGLKDTPAEYIAECVRRTSRRPG